MRDFGGIGKFAGFCNGYLANSWERLWSKMDHLEGINPVLWHIGPINVYRTCEPVMVPNDFDYASVCKEIPYGDGKPDNLGILDGHLVWVDYG